MEMKDSGKRRDFGTGAVRDVCDDKPALELISPFFEERLGMWLRKGALKYEHRNWEKGISMDQCVGSLRRHMMKYRMGLADEDHLAAIACNIMFLIHYETMVAKGVLPESISDLPNYVPEEKGVNG